MTDRSAAARARRGSVVGLGSGALAGFWPVALAAASGGLIAATFLDFGLHPLTWVAFVPLLFATRFAASDRDAVRQGLAAGLGANVPAFHWLVYTINVFGGFPLPLAAFFYLCLSAYSAMEFVLFTLALRRVGFGILGLGVPVLWVAAEFLFPNLFPWRMANALLQVPVLTQIGDLTGPFGLSFAVLWVNASIVLLFAKPRRFLPLLTAATAAFLIGVYGTGRLEQMQQLISAAPALRVGLVQGNVGIREKGRAAYFDINIDRYRRLSEALQDEVDVLIWPESVSQYWAPVDTERLSGQLNPFPQARSYLIFGGLAYDDRGNGEPLSYNSAFLMGPGGAVLGRYDKRILLPFGEYLPGASLIPGLASLSPHTGGFTAGRDIVTLDVPRLARFAPLVCYEDVPSGIARAMTRAGAQVLLTVFNDAWFGPSMAPYQHEALAAWRAIENRRYFLRVGNAGATGVLDPAGRVVSRLGLFTEETLVANIRALDVETFYTRWGDVFGWSVVAIAAAAIASASFAGRRSVTGDRSGASGASRG